MADYNSDRTGANIDATLDKVDVRDTVIDIGSNTTNRITVNSTGNVGIGTASPSHLLDLEAGAVTARLHSTSGNSAFLIESVDSGESKIFFSDNSDNNVGRIEYHHANNSLQFFTNDSESARFDSARNLLVGTTSFSLTSSGIKLDADGNISANQDDQACAFFGRLGSDGEIVRFRKDGATVGSIGAFANSTSFCGASAGIYFNGTNINPTTGDPTVRTDGVSDIGQVTQRFRDLYLSGGVYLGGTGAANKLDDYEEGTWTPTNYNDPTGTVTSTGSYTKVGKQVTVQGVIRIDSNFTAGGLGGLPFMPSGNSDVSSVRGIFNTFSDGRDLYIRLLHGTTLFNTYADLNGTPAYLATTDGTIRFLMSYETNA